MSDFGDSKDSPNVEPQSLRPAGHDVSTSYTGNQEDRHQVGEPSNRDALRQEVTTEHEKLSPESVYVHQTRGRGAQIPWYLGPRDRPVLDEGLEAQHKLRGGTASHPIGIICPNIRLPWFHGKEDEQVEKYFRKLKRLKTIYDWTNDHLLNMALLGLKGRADDWAGAIPDADKDTFDKLETQMVKIFGDGRAKWHKHAETGKGPERY